MRLLRNNSYRAGETAQKAEVNHSLDRPASPAAYIEDAIEPVTVIASHYDDGVDDADAGTAELGSARQNLGALALIVFLAKCHQSCKASSSGYVE
jgi:hypothetical protein